MAFQVIPGLRGRDQHGGGPAGAGSGSGRGLLVSAVQLHLLKHLEGEESRGGGDHQLLDVRGPVDELRRHLHGLGPMQQVQDVSGTVG